MTDAVLVLLGYKHREGKYAPRQGDPAVVSQVKRTVMVDKSNENIPMAYGDIYRVDGLSPLTPFTQCATTALNGVQARIARILPAHDPVLRREFVQESCKYWKSNITPIQSDLVDWEDWLNWVQDRGVYTVDEIEKMRRFAEENPNRMFVGGETVKRMKVGVFIKLEFYTEYKPSRNIFAVDLTTKLHFSALVYLFEKHIVELFGYHNDEAVQAKRAWTFKKIPVHARGKFMRDLGCGKCFDTDFSSAECHHKEYVMWLFIFAMRLAFMGLAWAKPYVDELDEYLQNPHKCKSQFWKFMLGVVLLSGHPITSIANAMFNVCVIIFTIYKHPGMCVEWFAVEGDDGVGVFKGTPPPDKFFTDLGFLLKYNVGQSDVTGFCGIMFDLESGDNIADIYKQMVKIPWLFKRFGRSNTRRRLIRAKALSMYYQYPNCPILSHYCYRILELTSGMNLGSVVKHVDRYRRDQLYEALQSKFYQKPPDIKNTTRETVSLLFGISPDEQIRIEGALSQMETNVYVSALLFHSPDVYVMSWLNYVDVYEAPTRGDNH